MRGVKVVVCDDEMKLGSGKKVIPVSCAIYCPRCKDVLAHGPMKNETIIGINGALYEFKNPLHVHSCGKKLMQIGVSSEEYRAWDAQRKFIVPPKECEHERIPTHSRDHSPE